MSFTHLDLFAGIGGFSRAVHWLGGTTIGFVEWDAWNRRVLAKHWPEAHFHGDIKTFTAATLREWGIRTYPDTGVADAGGGRPTEQAEAVAGLSLADRERGRRARRLDLLTGGYPCQPFSHAGKRLGTADDRHLWPEMRRVINLTRPRFVLAENVAGHITMGLDTVLADLEADGYTCGAIVVPACAVNALHRRDRVWILATREIPDAHGRRRGKCDAQERRLPEPDGCRDGQPSTVADSEGGQPGESTQRQGRQDSERGSADLRGDTATWLETGRGVAHAASRGLRRGRASGHERQLAQRGEGAAVADTDRGRLVQRAERDLDAEQPGLEAPRGHDALRHGASLPGRGTEIARPVDPRIDGVSAGLVRQLADRSAWGDPDVIRAMWADGSWELDLPRVVVEEPERRQKLQAAGNAIVPIVAYEILRVMLGEEAGCA